MPTIKVPDDDDNHRLYDLLSSCDYERANQDFSNSFFELQVASEAEYQRIVDTVGEYDSGGIDNLGSHINDLTTTYEEGVSLLKAFCLLDYYKRRHPEAYSEFFKMTRRY